MRKIVIQNFLITFGSKGIGFILSIYLARILVKEDFGFYSSINLLLLYLPFLHMGLMNGVAIELPKVYNVYSDKRAADLFNSYFFLSMIIQLLSGIGIFLFLDSSSWQLLVIVFLYYFFLKAGENIKIYYLSLMKLSEANLAKFLTEVLAPLAALVLFYAFKNLESLFSGYLAINLLFFVFSLYFARRLIRTHGFHSRNFIPFIRKILRTGFPVFITWAIDTLFKSLDRLFIWQFYSRVDLADYTFAATMASVLFLASASVLSPYGQLLYKQIAMGNVRRAHYTIRKTNVRILLMNVVLMGLIIAAYPLITLYTGKYGENYMLMILMLPSSLLISISGLLIYFMNSTYKAKRLIRYQVVALAINVVLNLLITYMKLPLIWFAVAGMITTIVFFLQLFIFVRKDYLHKFYKR